MIVNRFEQRMFSSGLRNADIEQVLGDSFAACIPNHYALVREAIDRGVPLDEVKPGNKITLQLKKLIVPHSRRARRRRRRAAGARSSSSLARALGSNGTTGSRNEHGRPFHRPPHRRAGTGAGEDEPSPALEGVSWTVFPEPAPSRSPRSAANPLLSDKLLDAKVRLHRRLIEEINLSGAGKAAGGRDPRAHPAAGHPIHPGRAARAQPSRSSTTSSPRSSTR